MSYDTIKASAERRERWAAKSKVQSPKSKETISPAGDAAGVAPSRTGAGGSATRPRSAGKNMLAQVEASTDVAWLKAMMGSADYQVTIRYAAQRRLGVLFRKGKRR